MLSVVSDQRPIQTRCLQTLEIGQ